jgi:hypothetical protein
MNRWFSFNMCNLFWQSSPYFILEKAVWTRNSEHFLLPNKRLNTKQIVPLFSAIPVHAIGDNLSKLKLTRTINCKMKENKSLVLHVVLGLAVWSIILCSESFGEHFSILKVPHAWTFSNFQLQLFKLALPMPIPGQRDKGGLSNEPAKDPTFSLEGNEGSGDSGVKKTSTLPQQNYVNNVQPNNSDCVFIFC